MENKIYKKFDLTGQIVIITGGAGLLGIQHVETVIELGGVPIILDISSQAINKAINKFSKSCQGFVVDITDEEALKKILKHIVANYKKVDVLINNACNNPKAKNLKINKDRSHLENFSLDKWNDDLSVGLTGAFLCSKIFGTQMALSGKGVILNIASDLAVIAPDQRIYNKPGLAPEQQPVKPITYSVIKSGLIGLTKYLATYWNNAGVRTNALLPGGIYNGQDEIFVKKLTKLIPLGRMANIDEYKAAVAFLISDASSYMTGSSLVIDGGRTVW